MLSYTFIKLRKADLEHFRTSNKQQEVGQLNRNPHPTTYNYTLPEMSN